MTRQSVLNNETDSARSPSVREDRVSRYGWKVLAGSAAGYALDGFDLLILGFMLAALKY